MKKIIAFIFFMQAFFIFAINAKVAIPWEPLIEESDAVCIGEIIKLPDKFSEDDYNDCIVNIKKIIIGNDLTVGEHSISLKSFPYFNISLPVGLYSPKIDYDIKIGGTYILFLKKHHLNKYIKYKNLNKPCSLFPTIEYNILTDIDKITNIKDKCEFLRELYEKKQYEKWILENENITYLKSSFIAESFHVEIVLPLVKKYNLYPLASWSFFEKVYPDERLNQYKTHGDITKEELKKIIEEFKETVLKILSEHEYSNINIENKKDFSLLINYDDKYRTGRIILKAIEKRNGNFTLRLALGEILTKQKKEYDKIKKDLILNGKFKNVTMGICEIKVPETWEEIPDDNPFNNFFNNFSNTSISKNSNKLQFKIVASTGNPNRVMLKKFSSNFSTRNYLNIQSGLRIIEDEGIISNVMSSNGSPHPGFEMIIDKKDSIKINGFDAGFLTELYSDGGSMINGELYIEYYIEKSYFIQLTPNRLAVIIFSVPENLFKCYEKKFHEIAETVTLIENI